MNRPPRPRSATLAGLLLASTLTQALAQAPAPQPPQPLLQPPLTTAADLADPARAKAIADWWDQAGPDPHFTGAGNLKLAWRAYRQADAARERGAVVVVNGRTETLLKYQELAFDLFRQGYSVYLYDHRGQGLSEREPDVAAADKRQRGHVVQFDSFVDDLRSFMRQVVRPAGHRQHFLLAHSMGGAISALFLEGGGPEVAMLRGAALSSPMLAIKGLGDSPADGLLCGIAGLGATVGLDSRYAPGGSDWALEKYAYKDGKGKFNPYTTDETRFKRFVKLYEDVAAVRLGGPTFGWVSQSCDAAKRAREGGAAVRTPVLLLTAGDDAIVHNSGAQRFCEALRSTQPGRGCGGPDGGPVNIPGAQHELFIESDALRGAALSQVLRFFEAQSQK